MGWSRFDEAAAPYTAAEISAERSRYAESRSFAGRDDQSDVARDQADPAARPIDPNLRAF
jgi:hypothetical protein